MAKYIASLGHCALLNSWELQQHLERLLVAFLCDQGMMKGVCTKVLLGAFWSTSWYPPLACRS